MVAFYNWCVCVKNELFTLLFKSNSPNAIVSEIILINTQQRSAISVGLSSPNLGSILLLRP